MVESISTGGGRFEARYGFDHFCSRFHAPLETLRAFGPCFLHVPGFVTPIHLKPKTHRKFGTSCFWMRMKNAPRFVGIAASPSRPTLPPAHFQLLPYPLVHVIS